jgi:branched-chain amino acid transport system permease protein
VDALTHRLGRSAAASGILLVAVALLGLLYTATGGSSRELLVDDTLVNLLVVLGLQVFVGNTGVLSFGHIGFVEIAAYATALLAIPAAEKAAQLENAPWGLADVALAPFPATLVAIVVTVAVGAVIGIAIARASGLAATMITLAILFVTDQVVKNWDDLTKGANGLKDIPQLGSRWWLFVAVFAGLFVAHWFQETRIGRFAIAAREDELAAPALGIRLSTSRYAAWLVSIVLVALGGSLTAQRIGNVNPRQFTFEVGILILAMLVVGGMRTVTGAVVGTIVVTAGNEAFRQLGDPQRLDIERFPDLFLGVALLGIMLLRPGGLLGDLDVAGRLRRTWRTPHAESTGTPELGTRALVAEDVSVRFGGFMALDGANLRVEPGRIVGLVGPNGAGKTTFFNVISGLVEESGGQVHLGDQDLGPLPVHGVARSGLARTFQNLRLFQDLSVRENVAVAALVAERFRPDRATIGVDALLADAGLSAHADRRAGTLDYGNQRRLELARAAALAPEFLLLDEPTSGMSDAESLAMVDHVRSTAAKLGAGVLVIDHDLGFISRICDHVVVLAEGRVLAEGTPEEIRRNPAVAAAYLGSAAET